MERKDLIKIWKDSVFKINNINEYDMIMDLLEDMNIVFANGKKPREVDIWDKYKDDCGLILNKVGREYKCSAIKTRKAQTAFHKRVIDIGDISE